MKTLISFVLLALVAMPALADDRQVSNQSLARMGLGKMVSVSENEGAMVRGNGVFSFSTAFVAGGFRIPTQTVSSPGTGPANTISFAIGVGAIAFGSASASTN